MFLARFELYGPRAFANSKYEHDYAAVRQQSHDSGSTLVYKKIPDETRPFAAVDRPLHLANYIGVLFGEIDKIFRVVSRLLECTGISASLLRVHRKAPKNMYGSGVHSGHLVGRWIFSDDSTMLCKEYWM
jgi:hypothetical protein